MRVESRYHHVNDLKLCDLTVITFSYNSLTVQGSGSEKFRYLGGIRQQSENPKINRDLLLPWFDVTYAMPTMAVPMLLVAERSQVSLRPKGLPFAQTDGGLRSLLWI